MTQQEQSHLLIKGNKLQYKAYKFTHLTAIKRLYQILMVLRTDERKLWTITEIDRYYPNSINYILSIAVKNNLLRKIPGNEIKTNFRKYKQVVDAFGKNYYQITKEGKQFIEQINQILAVFE